MSKNKMKQSVKSSSKAKSKPAVKVKAMAKTTAKSSKPVSKVKAAANKSSAKKVAAKAPAKKVEAKAQPKKVSAAQAAKIKVDSKAAKAPAKVEAKKAAPKPEPEVVKAKPVSKITEKANAKKGKAKKVEASNELEDDFIPDDDFGGINEIGEYEEELKAVETLDIEVEEELEWSLDTKAPIDEEVYLTDAEGNRYCRSKDCDQIASVDGYCRFHYLLFWKRIQVRKKILADGKLVKYIEELMARYPDKFIEMVRRDLRTQKDFVSAIQELEIDESELNAEAEEETQSFINEVHGIGETSGLDEEEF